MSTTRNNYFNELIVALNYTLLANCVIWTLLQPPVITYCKLLKVCIFCQYKI